MSKESTLGCKYLSWERLPRLQAREKSASSRDRGYVRNTQWIEKKRAVILVKLGTGEIYTGEGKKCRLNSEYIFFIVQNSNLPLELHPQANKRGRGGSAFLASPDHMRMIDQVLLFADIFEHLPSVHGAMAFLVLYDVERRRNREVWINKTGVSLFRISALTFSPPALHWKVLSHPYPSIVLSDKMLWTERRDNRRILCFFFFL